MIFYTDICLKSRPPLWVHETHFHLAYDGMEDYHSYHVRHQTWQLLAVLDTLIWVLSCKKVPKVHRT